MCYFKSAVKYKDAVEPFNLTGILYKSIHTISLLCQLLLNWLFFIFIWRHKSPTHSDQNILAIPCMEGFIINIKFTYLNITCITKDFWLSRSLYTLYISPLSKKFGTNSSIPTPNVIWLLILLLWCICSSSDTTVQHVQVSAFAVKCHRAI